MTWLIARLKEPSSWRGIVWLLTFAGVTLEPAQAEAIITAGIALAGLLGVFTNDLPAATSQAPQTELPPIELQARPNAVPDRRLDDSAVDLVPRRRVATVVGDGAFGITERMQSPVQTERESESFGFNDQ